MESLYGNTNVFCPDDHKDEKFIYTNGAKTALAGFPGCMMTKTAVAVG